MKYLLAILVLIVISCNKKPHLDADLPKGFVEFYDRFHEDSIYQMDHIIFPLEGLPPGGGNGEDDNYKWGKDGWAMHKPFDESNTEYVRDIYSIDSNIVIEKIKLATNDYGMERRFARTHNNEWQLIYYAAMNKLVKNTSNQTEGDTFAE